MENAIAKFKHLLATIERPGMDKLAAFLEESDFYTAPASTQYHGAEKGGLVKHSLAVCENMGLLTHAFPRLTQLYTIETLRLVALTHDICKTGFYTVEMRNKKDHTTADGVYHPGWGSYPFYAIDDTLPMGHGEKSVYLLMSCGVPLSVDEAAAINWHMGSFDDRANSYGGSRTLSKALDTWPLVAALHMADLAANSFDKI